MHCVRRFNVGQRMFPYVVPRVCHLLVLVYSRVGWWGCHAHAVLCVCLCGAELKNGGFPQQISLLFWFNLCMQILKIFLRRQIYGV